MPDAVNNPSHYHSHPSGVACVELNRQFAGSLAAAIKYFWRLGQKGDAIEDAEKGLWYVRDAAQSSPTWQHHLARFADEPTALVWIEKVLDREPRGTLLHELLLGFCNNRSLGFARSRLTLILNDMKSRVGAGQ